MGIASEFATWYSLPLCFLCSGGGFGLVWSSRLLLVGFSKLVSRARTHDDDDDVMTTTTTMRNRIRLSARTFHEPVGCGVCFFASFMLSSAFDRKKGWSIGKKEKRETAFSAQRRQVVVVSVWGRE